MIPFQILYGTHPIGVCDLTDLGTLKQISVYGEYFATTISKLHEWVKKRLQDDNYKYK